jgi:hypothetical protein
MGAVYWYKPLLKIKTHRNGSGRSGFQSLEIARWAPREKGGAMEWRDGLRPGGRTPRLYVIVDGGRAVHKFTGETIPGVLVVLSAQYHQCGKWSSTTYQIQTARGVRAVELLSPLHGTWGDSFTSWLDAAQALGCDVDSAREITRVEYRKTFERLEALDAALESLEEEEGDDDAEIVVITFGSPTNRAAEDGFWFDPKGGRTSDGREVVVTPGPDGDWESATCPQGRVVSVKRSPGYHGGSISVTVAVAPQR